MARDQEHRFNKTEYQEAEAEVYPMVSAQIMEVETKMHPEVPLRVQKTFCSLLGDDDDIGMGEED